MKIKLLSLLCMFVFVASSCATPGSFFRKDYSHQIEEDFRFDVKGYTKTVDLKLKYWDTYVFAITNGDIGFPQKYDFKGKLNLQFFYKNKLIKKTDITTWDMALDMTSKDAFYKEIYLSYFKIPLNHRYVNNLSLKVTVIEPDLQLTDFGKDLKIVIGISGKP